MSICICSKCAILLFSISLSLFVSKLCHSPQKSTRVEFIFNWNPVRGELIKKSHPSHANNYWIINKAKLSFCFWVYSDIWIGNVILPVDFYLADAFLRNKTSFWLQASRRNIVNHAHMKYMGFEVVFIEFFPRRHFYV